MPSAFSHAVCAIALGSAFRKNPGKIQMTVIGIVCSVLPDADVLSFKFGISYESMWGHRGISHSLFFAAILALLVLIIFYSQEKEKTTLIKLLLAEEKPTEGTVSFHSDNIHKLKGNLYEFMAFHNMKTIIDLLNFLVLFSLIKFFQNVFSLPPYSIMYVHDDGYQQECGLQQS